MIVPELLDEIFIAETMYGFHMDLFAQRRRAWQFKAAAFSWLQAQHYRRKMVRAQLVQHSIVETGIKQRIQKFSNIPPMVV